MFPPDHETRLLLVKEHQAELRRQARHPAREPKADRFLTMVAVSRPPAHQTAPPARLLARSWLRWRRRNARSRAAEAS
jgi:hypothetical protein